MGPACAQRIGQQAASGAMQGMRQELDDQGAGNHPVQTAGERMALGAVDALDRPEQQARIREMIAAAVTEAVSTAMRTASGGAPADPESESPIELAASQAAETAAQAAVARIVEELGAGGDGPLGRSLAATSQKMAAAAVGGAVEAAVVRLPGCQPGQGQACLERLTTELARAAAAGVVLGTRDALGWPFLVLAFVAGVLAALLVIWIWSLRHGAPRVLRTRTT